MFHFIENASIKNKLVYFSLLITGTAFLIAFFIFFLFYLVTYRNSVFVNLTFQAQIIEKSEVLSIGV